MEKYISPSSKTIAFKNICLTVVIVLLSGILYQFANHLFHTSQPTSLQGGKTSIEIYSNQTHDDLTLLFQHAINNAKESVVLMIYSLHDSHIIQALQSASESGIPVYIVYDGEATSDLRQRLPKATIVRYHGDSIMHQKLLIVDNQMIWIGSANMTKSSLNIHSNLVLEIDNKSLAEALTKRVKSMDERGNHSPLKHLTTTAGEQNLEFWVLPDDPQAVAKIIDLLRLAQKTIKVAMFTWTRTDFAEELIAAKKRGVHVEVVIDRYSGNGVSAKVVRLLLKNGVSVRLSVGSKLMHHKFAYIDDTLLISGSANWTLRAFTQNDDFFTILYPLTNRQKAKMDRIWNLVVKESEPVKK